jgi:ADP-ribose pyrophosphatase YjhB (NUDIX family)
MFEQDNIKHHIERHVINYLMFHEYAKFSEMRPLRVDTNLFSYHLKLLIKDGYITKTDQGYTLSSKGLVYVDRVSSEKMKLRSQPKIITMLLVQDGYGKVLLHRRAKQPYINTWTLPYGKMHIDDESVLSAARRESIEKLQFDPHKLRHVGDCYIVVDHEEKAPIDRPAIPLEEGTSVSVAEATVTKIDSRTLAHIVRFETDAIAATDDLQWVKPLDLAKQSLAPAVEQIVTRAFFGDEFFFEEFRQSTVQ